MINGIEIIDSHCHIYPEKIAERAIMGTDSFYGGHSLCKGTVGDLLENGVKAGVDKFIVQSVATTTKQVPSINKFISDEVKNHPDRLIGLGTLHPESEDIRGDIENIISLGLLGVKLHPDIQGFKIDDYRCLKIYEICEEKGLPILMHMGDYRYDFSHPRRLVPILETYENLTIIGAHLGGWSVWDDAIEAFRDIKRFFVDCSSCFGYTEHSRVKELIRIYGAERVLFGTDYPMWKAEAELQALFALNLSDDELKHILSINAKKIFDWRN